MLWERVVRGIRTLTVGALCAIIAYEAVTTRIRGVGGGKLRQCRREEEVVDRALIGGKKSFFIMYEAVRGGLNR